MKVYKVPLYKVVREDKKCYWILYVEYVCDIIIMRKFNKFYEISTECPLNVAPCCCRTSDGNIVIHKQKWRYPNKTIGNYFIPFTACVDANMVTVAEVVDYFAANEQWLSIYQSYIKASLPLEQQKIKKYLEDKERKEIGIDYGYKD